MSYIRSGTNKENLYIFGSPNIEIWGEEEHLINIPPKDFNKTLEEAEKRFDHKGKYKYLDWADDELDDVKVGNFSIEVIKQGINLGSFNFVFNDKKIMVSEATLYYLIKTNRHRWSFSSKIKLWRLHEDSD